MWKELIEPRAEAGANDLFVRRAKATPPRRTPFRLADYVRPLDFEPKNKPFLTSAPDRLPPQADELLAVWPAAQRAAQEMLVALYPCGDPRYPDKNTIGGCYGCKSNQLQDFGHVYSSVTNPVGFVEGIIVSMANWRLYSLGLSHDEWSDEFLSCDDEPKHAFPLRPRERVRAGNVVHTLYCCAHALAFHQRLLDLPLPPYGAAYSARVAYERVRRGIDGVEGLLPYTTPAGLDLLEGVAQWSRKLLDLTPPPTGT